MFSKIGEYLETLQTHLAAIGSSVLARVLNLFLGRGESAGAHVAFIRQDALVRLDVGQHVVGAHKASIAEIALVPTIVGVDGHVATFVLGPRELLVAQVALEWLVAGVARVVTSQVEFDGVALFATVAVVETVCCLNGLTCKREVYNYSNVQTKPNRIL